MELTHDKRNGWEAETVYPLEIVGTDNLGRPVEFKLFLKTRKDSYGKLATDATVYRIGAHFRTHAFSFGGHGDFSRAITKTTTRGTEKNVRQQHAEAEAQIAGVLDAARKHYQDARNIAV